MRLWNLFRNGPGDRGAGSGAPFVITLDGTIYSDETGRLTEVELAGGAKRVLGAGRWVVEQGRILELANESPTYRPTFAQMQTLVAHLAEMGSNLSGDGKGVLVIVYAEIDQNGRGKNGARYRVTKSVAGIELIPEERTP
jgi:hypothetical protein